MIYEQFYEEINEELQAMISDPLPVTKLFVGGSGCDIPEDLTKHVGEHGIVFFTKEESDAQSAY